MPNNKWMNNYLINLFSFLQYQCIAASKKYIALGASTGAIYIFQKDTHKYLELVTSDKPVRKRLNLFTQIQFYVEQHM